MVINDGKELINVIDLPIDRQISHIIQVHEPEKRTDEECKLIAKWLLDVEKENVKPSRRIFEKIPLSVLCEVGQYIKLQCYDSSELIFLQTETGVSFYVILSGSVEIYDTDISKIDREQHRMYVDGKIRQELQLCKKEANTDPECPSKLLGTSVQKSKLLTILPQGNTFGEIALLTNKTIRTASAVAQGYTELITITKPLYDRTIKKYQSSSLDFEEKLRFLPSVDVFSDWGANRWNHLAYWIEELVYPRGALILEEGVKGKYIGLIHSGECKLLCHSPKESIHKGENIDICIIGPKNIIGEGSILSCETIRNYSVVTLTEVKLFVIRDSNFKKLANLAKVYYIYYYLGYWCIK